MSYERRNVYNHEDQPILFEGLMYNNYRPCNIDGAMELNDNFRIWYEAKQEGVKLLTGQRLLLERTVEDAATAGKNAIAIIADHREPLGKPVYLAKCNVRCFKINKSGWLKPNQPTTVQQMTDWLMENYFAESESFYKFFNGEYYYETET